MRYELTKDLETGNQLIDGEHRELFRAVNRLLDACASGQGRAQIAETANFLSSYVKTHFGDEEKFQKETKYPGYTAHKLFHDGYVRQIDQICRHLAQEGSTVSVLTNLNRQIGILVSHIRTEDKKVAEWARNHK